VISIPRRKKQEVSTKVEQREASSTRRSRSKSRSSKSSVQQVVAAKTTITATAARARRKSKRREIDVESLAEEYFNDLYSYLGLDTLGVERQVAVKIIGEVLSMLYEGASSKPALDAVLKKIRRFRDSVNAVIAKWLLETVKEPTPEQLEFIVTSGGRLVVPEISRLFSIIKKTGRADLLSHLEALWEKYGHPTPVRCPKCGFRAVMPDYSCAVCGYVVSDEYVKRELNFAEKFKEYISRASVAELRDVADLGFVLLGEDGVVNPRYGHKLLAEGKYLYTVYLKQQEISTILEEISQRKLEI